MEQQTALEWFAERLKQINGEDNPWFDIPLSLLEQAKAMEKEQIEDAHEEGIQRCYLEVDDFGARLVKPIEGIAGHDYYYFKYETNGL
jgi:hypothetical protein